MNQTEQKGKKRISFPKAFVGRPEEAPPAGEGRP